MDLRHYLFGDLDALGDVELRAGRLSVERKFAAAATAPQTAPGKSAALLPPDRSASVRGTPSISLNAGNRSTSVRAAPSVSLSAGDRSTSVRGPQSAAVQTSARSAAPGPLGPVQTSGRSTRPAVPPAKKTAALSVRGGLLDVPTGRGGNLRRTLGDIVGGVEWNPNDKVWICTGKRYLKLCDPYDAALPSHPWIMGGVKGTAGDDYGAILYPDGTPAIASYWLPAVDLGKWGFTPYVPGSFFQDAVPSGDELQRLGGQGRGWWWGPDEYGTWFWILDYFDGRGYDREYPMPRRGTAPPWDYNPEKVDVKSVGVTIERTRHMWRTNFDWSRNPPSLPWLHLNLIPEPDTVQWSLADAELRGISGAVEFSELPGIAWLDLNFLDAIRTGAHGMPKLVRDDNTIDRAAMGAFMENEPAWAIAMGYGRNGAGVGATINDIGSPVPGVVHEQPAPKSTSGGGDTDPRTKDILDRMLRRNQSDAADTTGDETNTTGGGETDTTGGGTTDTTTTTTATTTSTAAQQFGPLPLPLPRDLDLGTSDAELDAMLADMTEEELQQLIASAEAGG